MNEEAGGAILRPFFVAARYDHGVHEHPGGQDDPMQVRSPLPDSHAIIPFARAMAS